MAGKKGMSDNEKNAKMDVVSHLRDMAAGAMKNKMSSKGMHKVSVASDSSEGLKHGLEKAKEIVGEGGDSDSPLHMSEGGEVDGNRPASETGDEEEAQMLHEAENPEQDALDAHKEHSGSEDESSEESPEDASSEFDDMDEEEINRKLEQLMALKKKKDSKKSS